MTDMKELHLAIGLFRGLTNCEEKLLERGYLIVHCITQIIVDKNMKTTKIICSLFI